MSKSTDWTPEGVIPSVLLPFHPDFSINEKAYRKHLRDVVGVDGISAITVNGHSSEVHACTVDEQQEVLGISLDEVGDQVPVIAGVYADGSLEAARIARILEAGGASCLLVFPPQSMTMGGQLRPEMAIVHFQMIAEATNLPLICFGYPLSGGLGYPHETLMGLVELVPSIRAVKDWSGDVMVHERNIRALQSLPRPVTVLTTHSASLLSSLVLGCNGLLSGAGSVIADLQVALFRAVRANDLATARAIHDRIYPLAQAFYVAPHLDMHNRMKEVLALLGRLPPAVVRPPLVKLPNYEIEQLKRAVAAAGLPRKRRRAIAAE